MEMENDDPLDLWIHQGRLPTSSSTRGRGVLLDRAAYFADADLRNATIAVSKTREGHEIQVTLCTSAEPPLVFHIDFAMEPRIIVTHNDLLLFRLALGHGNAQNRSFFNYFLYQAAASNDDGPPSLTLITHPPSFPDNHVGLLHDHDHDDDVPLALAPHNPKQHYIIAALVPIPLPGVITTSTSTTLEPSYGQSMCFPLVGSTPCYHRQVSPAKSSTSPNTLLASWVLLTYGGASCSSTSSMTTNRQPSFPCRHRSNTVKGLRTTHGKFGTSSLTYKALSDMWSWMSIFLHTPILHVHPATLLMDGQPPPGVGTPSPPHGARTTRYKHLILLLPCLVYPITSNPILSLRGSMLAIPCSVCTAMLSSLWLRWTIFDKKAWILPVDLSKRMMYQPVDFVGASRTAGIEFTYMQTTISSYPGKKRKQKQLKGSSSKKRPESVVLPLPGDGGGGRKQPNGEGGSMEIEFPMLL
uniref:Uncharacterized protein n=1 Tax=Leersia perrieri TaxID=77586 RepID=A0A0D9XGY7_9ORYZ